MIYQYGVPMCRFCSTVEDDRKANGGFLTEEQSRIALEEIANRILCGEPAEHFQKVLDSILETEMADRDLDAEEAWEKANRNDG